MALPVGYSVVVPQFIGVIGASDDHQIKAPRDPHFGGANQEVLLVGHPSTTLPNPSPPPGKINSVT
ncbi:MAG: hypothetical protein WCL39_13740, partial [Armatimonadota bacterium]